MPKSADFEKVYNKFVKLYGSEKGKDAYYAWLNKKGYDDTKPFPGKKKETHSCNITGVETKEEGNEFHVYGFIGTSHLDEVKDIIPKETLETWCSQINSTGLASGLYHSEAKTGEVFGNAENAKVIQLPDGKYALYADTKYVKGTPSSDYIIDKWTKGELNSFSITYDTEGSNTCEFELDGEDVIRTIGNDTKLCGYTATNNDRAANKNAIATDFSFKELKELINQKTNEAKKMETKETPAAPPAPTEQKETVDIKAIAKEMKESILREIALEMKNTPPANAPMHNAGEKIEKEKKELETKEKEFQSRITEFKEKVLLHKAGKNEQWAETKEMESYMKRNGAKFVSGETVENSKPIPFEIKEQPIRKVSGYEGREMELPKGTFSRLEIKGIPTHLTTDDDYSGAQTTYVTALANYEQAPARYNDIYGPYIINQLNEETTTWNLLGKDDYSGYSSIAFRVRKGRNATAGTYAFGSEPGWDSNESLLKCNLGFVTSYVEVAAEWEAMELAKGAGGIDVYQTALDYGTLDLMKYLNGQIFSTGDGTLETASLGFETLVKTNAGGASTLYGRSRVTYTTLDSGGYEDLSSAPFTLDQGRKMVETVRVNGASLKDLVFITSLRQKRLFYQLIQDMQRLVPTSTRVGFMGVPELDSIPIFEDVALDEASKTDDVYLIDTRHTKIAMKKAPTYIEMAQISLHRRGIIWLMWNLYSTAPNHNYWTYGAATS